MATEKIDQTVPEEQVGVAEDVKPVLPPESQETESVDNEVNAAAGESVAEKEDNVATPEKEAVDFSDEEARLAAEAPEYDLGEAVADEEETAEAEKSMTEERDFDLTGKTKEELLDMFSEMLATKPVQSLRRDVEAIKVAFYKLHRSEVEQMRKSFLESGGTAEDFMAPVDPSELRLKELFADYRKKRDEFIANLERSKEDNLSIKLKIIEDLKELINSNETLNHTFMVFRDLQQRWKETGPVPQAQVKDLWETYNLHVENFYNFIKINKELRDLDLKRNYEAKLAL